MAATLLATQRSNEFAPESAHGLLVERTGIRFASRPGGVVDIEIVVTNTGIEHSTPTHASISAAPLGAFVRWRPLTTVPVPGLAPNESFVVRAQALRPRRQPLGAPGRVPPRQLLVALGADDDDETWRQVASGTTKERASGRLPADPFELLMRGNPHWAGNLNIFIGERAVERHLARSLRVYPGRANFAMFMVGTGRDAYAFQLHGTAADWDAALFDMTRARSLLPLGQGCVLPVDRWIESTGHSAMVLVFHPPARCSEGTIEVHVEQRSTGNTAVVEFSLDPNAAGPGCYVV